MDDATLFDYVFNFNEKIVRLAAGVKPTLGSLFKRIYKPFRPIRVRYRDVVSIEAMKLLTGGDGIYDGAVIYEPQIKTYQEARARSKAEIETYKNPIVTITFKTNKDGLHP